MGVRAPLQKGTMQMKECITATWLWIKVWLEVASWACNCWSVTLHTALAGPKGWICKSNLLACQCGVTDQQSWACQPHAIFRAVSAVEYRRAPSIWMLLQHWSFPENWSPNDWKSRTLEHHPGSTFDIPHHSWRHSCYTKTAASLAFRLSFRQKIVWEQDYTAARVEGCSQSHTYIFNIGKSVSEARFIQELSWLA